MLDLANVFDPVLARRPPFARLLDEAWSVLTCRPAQLGHDELPRGRGRAVLVIPGFLCGDSFTADMRQVLALCGFRPFGWELGVNWGPTPRLLRGLDARVRDLSREHGPVALIGISLGGLLARNVAYDRPDDVGHVVTVASPICLPTASTLEPLVRLCAWRYSAEIDPGRLRSPLPVPSTIICTRDDGIVDWRSCRSDQPGDEVIELSGPHLTLGSTPAALSAIVRRLAQP
jgi:pimeloyl-ACP methyl ester carboxylesterase